MRVNETAPQIAATVPTSSPARGIQNAASRLVAAARRVSPHAAKGASAEPKVRSSAARPWVQTIEAGTVIAAARKRRLQVQRGGETVGIGGSPLGRSEA